MPKIKRFYELEPEIVELINQLAAKTRLNKNAVVAEAIELYAQYVSQKPVVSILTPRMETIEAPELPEAA